MQYTTIEAAKLLGIAERTVRQHIQNGNLVVEKKGRDYLIFQEEIERFKQVRRGRGRPKS